jgi:rhamnulokinase
MTAAMRHLAFDLGASSGRAILGRVDGGRLTTKEVYRFDTPLIEAHDHLYWDLSILEAEMDEALRVGLAAAPDVQSLSVDAWGVDYVPLDASGRPLRNPYSYRDHRTQGMLERALERVTRAQIYNTTGIQFMPINTLCQVLADIEQEPDLVAQTACRLPVADYFHYRLTGRPAIELSMASTTQLLDVRTRTWATDLMEALDIDPATWPDVVPPGTVLGRPDWERLPSDVLPTDMLPVGASPPDIRVVAGCSHDTACAVAAVPASDQPSRSTSTSGSWAYISCGTWSLLGVERRQPILSDAAQAASFTNELGRGGTVRFLKNLTGLWVLQECERVWAEAGDRFDHATLQQEAQAARALPPIDLNDPRFSERSDMPATVREHCRSHGQPEPRTRGEMVRLILESLAAAYADKVDVLEALTGQSISTIHMVGGGSRNDLLCQWTADATGRHLIAGPAEATAYGNLLIQAQAVGALPEALTLREVVRASVDLRSFQPSGAAPSASSSSAAHQR